MIKRISILVSFFIFHLGTSQGANKPIYFPQEQIATPDCLDATNKSDCFYSSMEEKLFTLLLDKKLVKTIKKIQKDTLYINSRLVFDSTNTVIKEKSYITVTEKRLKKRMKSDLKKLFFEVQVNNILNRKTPPSVSKHFLKFKYYISNSSKGIMLVLVPNKKKYSGGVIERIPVFPSCEGLADSLAQICFQKKIQEHIKKHFSYPPTALNNGISGIVYIQMIIDKNGNVGDIISKGSHELLNNEAKRIISLLPQFKPALHNGKPVSIPFSIPITFTLSL